MVLGGKHLKAKSSCLHIHCGIDHAMALTLEEIAKIPEIYLIFIPCNRLCSMFGNGTRHRPHAAFVKESRSSMEATALASSVALMDAMEVISKPCST